MDRFETQMTLASIRNDIHMEDSFYEEEQKYYDEIRPLINNETQKLAALVVSSPYRDVFVQKLGRMAVANMDMFQRSYHEKIVDLVQEENALISRYDRAHCQRAHRLGWRDPESIVAAQVYDGSGSGGSAQGLPCVFRIPGIDQ